jgi:WD40 repeat protein/serine/threonine protein kinase
MAATLYCPNGHDWSSRVGPTAERVDMCPVCGAAPARDTSVLASPTIVAERALLLPMPNTSTGAFDGGIPGYGSGPVPGYEILGELGRGGMGVVFKARQTNLQRIVALKMVLSGELASTVELARFRAEAEAAARLQHPNIVQLYEFGEARSADGTLLPYFALEYVSGGSLADRLDGTPQPARASADLIAHLARAMHYAHSQGVVHRDLKPGNVLLQSADHKPSSEAPTKPYPVAGNGPAIHGVRSTDYGLPKVTDFGLAKRMDSNQGQTQSGAVFGTPQYMAPEQAAGRSKSAGPPTDIYALGAMLYELITGRPPFQGETALETMLMVSRDEPVAPRLLNPAIPRDLETITLKCLLKDPPKRYVTAQDLADDLQRFLDDQPISARPAGPIERTRAWMRRHPTASSLIAVTMVAAAMLAAVFYHSHQKLKVAYADVENQRDTATREKEAAHHQLVRLTVANGIHLADQGDLLLALPWFVEALQLDENSPDRAAVHRMRLSAALTQCPSLAAAWPQSGRVTDAAFRPDGKAAATSSDDGTIKIWDPNNPSNQPRILHQDDVSVTQIAYRPDGAKLLAVSGDVVHVWSPAVDPPRAATLAHPAKVHRAAWSPNGSRIVTGSADGVARVWNAETGQPTGVEFRHPGGVTAVAVSRDGRHAASGGVDGNAQVWNLATGQPISPPIVLGSTVKVVLFTPGGKQLLTAAGHTAQLWDTVTGKSACRPLTHRQDLTDATLSDNGQMVGTASYDDTGGVWDADRDEWADDPLKHGSDVLAIAFSPDGKWVATASDDNTARVWDTRYGSPRTPSLPHAGTVVRAIFSPDGKRLLTAGGGGVTKLWVLPDVVAMPSSTPLPIAGSAEVRSRDGKLRIVANGDSARVYDASTSAPVSPPLIHRGPVTHVAFSPDGNRVVTASGDRTARVWDWRTGTAIGAAMEHGSQVNDAEFNLDGTRVVTGSDDNTARVWHATTGEPETPPMPFSGSVHRARFSPDGRLVLSAGTGTFDRIWDVTEGEAVALVRRDTPWVVAALADERSEVKWKLSTDLRPIATLRPLAEWLSGHRLDASGGLVPLNEEELRKVGARVGG